MDVTQDKELVALRQDQLLRTLEHLLELPATEVNTTLKQVRELGHYEGVLHAEESISEQI